DERAADLPEAGVLERAGLDLLSRSLACHPETRLIVVGEENVLGNPAAPLTGDCEIIRLFALALYEVTGKRPVDPNWDRRGRATQQYELNVQRLDVRFDQRLRALHQGALERGHWTGTATMRDPAAYWA